MEESRPGEALASGHIGLASVMQRVETAGGEFTLDRPGSRDPRRGPPAAGGGLGRRRAGGRGRGDGRLGDGRVSGNHGGRVVQRRLGGGGSVTGGSSTTAEG